MKTVAIIQARMGSNRFPGKVLKLIHGVSMLEWVVRAAREARLVDEVCVAAPMTLLDDRIEDACYDFGCPCRRFSGDQDDVLSRIYETAKAMRADIIVRLTGDCPLLDAAVIDEVVALQRLMGYEYTSNILAPFVWPDGLDVEVTTREALQWANSEATLPSDREHVTAILRRRQGLVRALHCPLGDFSQLKWSVNTPEDLSRVEALAGRVPGFSPEMIGKLRYSQLLVANHDLIQPGSRSLGEALREALAAERRRRDDRDDDGGVAVRRRSDGGGDGTATVSRSLTHSQAALARARTVLPYAASTYSRSYVAWGDDAPLYVSRGLGGHTWDVDGHEYIDLVMGLGAVILGHCDPDVTEAVQHQANTLTCGSLATELEAEAAELLLDKGLWQRGKWLVQWVTNGSDATSAAIRIARAATGRSGIVIFEGAYHGWHDWAVVSTERGYGVPEMEAIERWYLDDPDLDRVRNPRIAGLDYVAAVIIEPDQLTDQEISKAAHWARESGALVIFDEVLTWGRYPHWSAQNYTNANEPHPDLTCLGKGLANGMPLAAVVGREELMRQLAPGPQPNAFVSGSWFGHPLSLAACIATLRKHDPAALWKKAEKLNAVVKKSVARRLTVGDLPFSRISGGSGLNKTLRREMAESGVLWYCAHNLCQAHANDDIEAIGRAWQQVIERANQGIARGYHVEPNSIMRR